MFSFKEYAEYLKDNPKGYWFKRKLYGWGWAPAKWQGWTVVFIYLLLIIAFTFTVDGYATVQDMLFTFLLPLILLTSSLILICYKKGESPKWMWGIKKDDQTK